MTEDRANHPGRKPRYAEVREALVKGFITDSEATDLGSTQILQGPFDNKPGRPRKSEETIAKQVHKKAGLSQGDW
jgi:hypothetical protein